MTNWKVTIVRLALTGWLLFVVWHHAHWSVFLALLLVTLSIELTGFLLNQLFQSLNKKLETLKETPNAR